MKKIFAIILTVCLMASIFCFTAFAEWGDPFGPVVISVRAQVTEKNGGGIEVIGEYREFDEGWREAMYMADEDDLEMDGYERIIVDLHADWNAEYGWFTDDILQGVGFIYRAIHFPEEVKVTLNMNGHTINRGLTEAESDGEVMIIDEDADVIINDGKITGGFSDDGAGGITILDDANVTLNNVTVSGNTSAGDDGAAIAIYEDATLAMNGGSIHQNYLTNYVTLFNIKYNPYGALYADEATVTLNNVFITDNYTSDAYAEGVAIYATDSTVTMNECVVSGNAVSSKHRNAESVIAAYDSKLTIVNTEFKNNASKTGGNDNALLFYLEDSSLTMDGGKIIENNPKELFYFADSDAEIKGVTITDNTSGVIYVDNGSEKVNMIECTLGNNTPDNDMAEIRVKNKDTLVMTDCNLGDTTFENKNMVAGVGSIFGEGSLTMIVAITALVASMASIGVTVACNKKKTAPVNAADEDEE